MRAIPSGLLTVSVILLLACTLLACGADVELRPELQAQLDEYESLIDRFESKFAEARGDQAKFGDVGESYTREVHAWMRQWQSLAPNLTDEEGKAVKARINELNKRAERMLMGG